MSHKETMAILHATLPPEQHGGVKVDHGSNSGYGLHRKYEDAQSFYYKRGWLTDSQNSAGHRLFTDFQIAGIYAPTGMKYTQGGGGSAGMGTAQLEARDRCRKAIEAIDGAHAQRMVIDVCCYGQFLRHGDYGPTKAPDRMAMLREALGELARYYARLAAERRK